MQLFLKDMAEGLANVNLIDYYGITAYLSDADCLECPRYQALQIY